MSGRPGLSALAVRAMRRPGASLRSAWSQKLRLIIIVTGALPRPVRRVIFRPIGTVADTALRRRGDHSIAAPIRVIATEASGDHRSAVAQAERLAAGASVRTTSRLARVALAAGSPPAAARIMADVPATSSPAAAAVHGEIAFRLGHYSTAIELLDPILARRPDDKPVRRMLDRSRAELSLLDPAWRPELGTAGRTAHPIGDPVRGRILHLLTNSLPYRQAGYTVRAQSVGRAQLQQGLDPHMVTRAGFPSSEGVSRAPSREVVDGVTYHRVCPDLDPGLPIDRIATETARGLVPLIDSLRPALLQPTTNYVNGQIALALGERFGLPVVYEVRGFLEETWLSRMGDAASEGDRYLAARAVETACMRRAAGIVTLSETMRADILGRGGISPDDVVIIPNAVDLDRFTPGPRDEPLAASLGIGADETVIGYISSFAAYEGIEYLIRAVALLRDRGRSVRLLLVGDGDAWDALVATAREVGLDDGGVIFTGRVPHGDIERYYRTIDIFVVPRTNDRVSQLVTPLKPYEAMAMEKALVVSAVGALLEIVPEGETGRSFTPEDPIALADTIEPLLDDPELRRRLGVAARRWVAANRTWEGNGHRYRALYERLGAT